MYYVDALRTWAQRVSRERFPAHVISRHEVQS
jgi:hypothetical protein